MAFSIGSISIIAIVSFVLGKLWKNSENVLQTRQKAYIDVLGLIVFPEEISEFDSDVLNAESMGELRKAVAPINLVGSTDVQKRCTEYFTSLGYLKKILENDVAAMEAQVALEDARANYWAMCFEMRKDMLNFSVYGYREQIAAFRSKSLR